MPNQHTNQKPGLIHNLVLSFLANPVRAVLATLFFFILISIIGALLIADWIIIPF